ncbi:MAG TPA: ATP-binding cassette domain-containing protein, partial [Polyangia bacterium]|nr:ATP-binding cassette domain-containing protein [Polyangia bacterium]
MPPSGDSPDESAVVRDGAAVISDGAAVVVSDLTFVYPGATQPVFSRLSLRLPAGARCLLLGANGTGKSTLLRLIAGRHMIAHEVIRVLGRPA